MDDADSCCSGSSAPVTEAPAFEDVSSYLMRRYDADQDGRVTSTEYRRTPATFARLDRNGDGVIDASDFAGDRERRAGRRQAQRAQRVAARHFQTDQDPTVVDADEIQRAFTEFDVDGDGRLAEEEFRCGATTRLRPLPGDSSKQIRKLLDRVDPWRALLKAMDENRDGLLAREELASFFATRSEEGLWVFEDGGAGDAHDGSDGGDGAEGGEGGERARGLASLHPLRGRMAPDFTLSSPLGEEVTLSDLRGRPVALIFGSYT